MNRLFTHLEKLDYTLREACRSWTSCRSIVRSSLKKEERVRSQKYTKHNYVKRTLRHDKCNINISPSGGHVSGQVSGIVEQLIVLEQLLGRVVRLHALRTDEALNTENHQSQPRSSNFLQICLQCRKKATSWQLRKIKRPRYLRRLIMVKVCGGLLWLCVLGASLPRSLKRRK